MYSFYICQPRAVNQGTHRKVLGRNNYEHMINNIIRIPINENKTEL